MSEAVKPAKPKKEKPTPFRCIANKEASDMKKIIITIAAAMSLVSAPVSAQVVSISLHRWTQIQEAAKVICRIATEESGSASAIINKQAAHLNLNGDESFLMTSLCIMYISGRIDEK